MPTNDVKVKKESFNLVWEFSCVCVYVCVCMYGGVETMHAHT